MTFACFKARGEAAFAVKPNTRRATASKLSLYIFFAKEGGWVYKMEVGNDDARLRRERGVVRVE